MPSGQGSQSPGRKYLLSWGQSTLLEIQRELHPSIKSIPASVLAKGRDVYAICPCCDVYALGMDLETGYPFTEVDGQIATIHDLTSRPEWR